VQAPLDRLEQRGLVVPLGGRGGGWGEGRGAGAGLASAAQGALAAGARLRCSRALCVRLPPRPVPSPPLPDGVAALVGRARVFGVGLEPGVEALGWDGGGGREGRASAWGAVRAQRRCALQGGGRPGAPAAPGAANGRTLTVQNQTCRGGEGRARWLGGALAAFHPAQGKSFLYSPGTGPVSGAPARPPRPHLFRHRRHQADREPQVVSAPDAPHAAASRRSTHRGAV
jgi:hypothetical protein